MPLTPIDVANKQFKIAFRGYSLDEVDAFLDEVETELSRLLRDNAAGKDRTAGGFLPSGAPAEQSAAPAAPLPVPALSGMQGQEAALRTLLLAQRTADEAIAEARAEAEQIVNEARHEADTTLTQARSQADSAVSKAKAEAESTLGAAQRKAASVDQDVAARIQAATGDLDGRRRGLELRIDELRSFEREYRTRLKAYLETQLRDLDSRQGSDDGGAGVPASARAAAVGLTPGSAAGVK
ncbi:MAG: DivIVA domain-containing protein, partial [Frankiales bacterium]|nr:DivIVA domain-containing protein [Frankiales bacterium]